MMREDKARKEAELAQCRHELEDEQGKSRALSQQLDRLRALVESLDSTKEELVKRLQSTNQEKVTECQDKALLLADIQTYKRELLLKEQELADLRRSVEQIDGAKDELQQELDAKTEELVVAR
jgi:chromosome segregation ATPase